MQDRICFIRGIRRAHTLTLVLCRPDGKRKRSVRALRKSLMYIRYSAWFLRKSAVSAWDKENSLISWLLIINVITRITLLFWQKNRRTCFFYVNGQRSTVNGTIRVVGWRLPMNYGRTSRASLLVKCKHAAGDCCPLTVVRCLLVINVIIFSRRRRRLTQKLCRIVQGWCRRIRRGAHADACALPSGW